MLKESDPGSSAELSVVQTRMEKLKVGDPLLSELLSVSLPLHRND